MNADTKCEDCENSKEYKESALNIKAAVLLVVKSVFIIALVYAGAYALNAEMAAFLAEERANEDYAIIDHYDGQFQEIYEKRVNADYIFIGTSHFTHGITPEEFEKSGKKFFNFALNGSNPSYYVWWYNDVFKANEYVQPKAIIVGVDWFMFDSGWLWRRPDYDYKYMREVTKETGGYKGKWYDWDELYTYISNRFPYFSSRGRFIDLVLPPANDGDGDGDGDGNGKREYSITPDGFRLDLFYKGYVAWEAEYEGKSAGTARMTYYEEEKNAFVSLIDQFQSEGIPLVFVMAPEYLPGRRAPQFEEMTDIIASIADERDIPFLNYNLEFVSAINEDYTCYSDWGHLSDKGAHEFSKLLYEDLNEILKFEE